MNEETQLKINRSIYNKRVYSVEIVNKIKFDCFFLQIHILVTNFWDTEEIYCTKVPS